MEGRRLSTTFPPPASPTEEYKAWQVANPGHIGASLLNFLSDVHCVCVDPLHMGLNLAPKELRDTVVDLAIKVEARDDNGIQLLLNALRSASLNQVARRDDL
jgi:hypothetical protein